MLGFCFFEVGEHYLKNNNRILTQNMYEELKTLKMYNLNLMKKARGLVKS